MQDEKAARMMEQLNDEAVKLYRMSERRKNDADKMEAVKRALEYVVWQNNLEELARHADGLVDIVAYGLPIGGVCYCSLTNPDTTADWWDWKTVDPCGSTFELGFTLERPLNVPYFSQMAARQLMGEADDVTMADLEEEEPRSWRELRFCDSNGTPDCTLAHLFANTKTTTRDSFFISDGQIRRGLDTYLYFDGERPSDMTPYWPVDWTGYPEAFAEHEIKCMEECDRLSDVRRAGMRTRRDLKWCGG